MTQTLNRSINRRNKKKANHNERVSNKEPNNNFVASDKEIVEANTKGQAENPVGNDSEDTIHVEA